MNNERQESERMNRADFLNMIEDAGVVGAGGGGFPTAKKLEAEFSYYIANGAECEPLLRKDIELMQRFPAQIAETMSLVRDVLGAENLVFTAKRKYSSVWQKISTYLKENKISAKYLDDIFPAGDEFEIIHAVIGKVIPPAGIPLYVGAAVNNVETIFNIGRAVDGHPVVSKFVTVAGAVRRPFTAIVPIGTMSSMLIEFASPEIDNYGILEGGPMMGVVVPSERDEPVKKTTSGFIVLPKEHILLRYRQMPMQYILRIAASVCMQCQSCTDLCPRHLLGHPLEPHRIMRSTAMPLSLPVETMTAAMLCSECGVCELFACPMGLSPRRINSALKQRFAREGIRYQWRNGDLQVCYEREFRRIPTQRLAGRIVIEEYLRKESKFIPSFPEPERVVIALKQHTGAPAKPIVQVGENVNREQCIAEIPQGKLGAKLHSSISGKIVSVNENNIVIAR